MPGQLCLRPCWRRECAFWKGWTRPVPALCVAALLTTVQGCSWTCSREIPALPVLTSLERVERNGREGVWMSGDDAGRLALWIYDVTGEVGR